MTGFKHNLSSLLKLAIPLAFTGIVQSLSFFCETIFLAHLGKDVMAAGALVSWLFATIAVIFWGALSSINILVAHKHGASEHGDIRSIVRDGLSMAIVFSIPIFLLARNMAPVFLFFGQSATVVSLATAYLHALAWGVIPSFIVMAMLELILGLGNARTVMVYSMLFVALSLMLSYVLIFGKFGFPALGIAGAGWGMSISNLVSCIALSIYVGMRKDYRNYFQLILNFKKPFYLWELMQIGLPMGLMYCVEVGFFFALTLIMGTLGAVVLAANQIAMQYLGLLMSMVFSIAGAITVRMGHLLGAKEIVQAEQAGWIGVSLSGIFIFLLALIFWFFPDWLISVDFNVHEKQNQELVYYTKQLLFISPLFQILEAIRISLFGVLRALKDTRFTLLTSIISFWCLSLPIGYCFATYLNLNGAGYWWGMVVGVTISLLLLTWRFKIKIRHYRHPAGVLVPAK